MASNTSSPSNSSPVQKKLDIPTFDEIYELGEKLSFNLIFVDLQKVVCDALRKAFPCNTSNDSHSGIKIIQSNIIDYLSTNTNVDCIVSSSNAFGLMDHGFDRSICKILNDNNNEIERRIKEQIINKYNGEQPIGTCILIKTIHDTIKYLAHAPSRRINYSIKGTDNVYNAMKAICNEICLWNKNNSEKDQIKNVLLTGLGTFYGAVSPGESAKQIVLGWLLSRLPKPSIDDINWNYATSRQSLINFGGFNHFVHYVQNNKNALNSKQQNIIARALPKQIISKLNAEYEETLTKENLNVNGKQKQKKQNCSVM